MTRPALVGIVNITPDSFSGDGALGDAAYARAESLVQAGATILDLGAESTRPGATPVSAAVEWARLQPLLQQLQAAPWRKNIKMSVDTRHAETAAHALALGADMINDVSGLSDLAMQDVIRQHGCDCIVMHALTVPANPSVTLPKHADAVSEILRWKQETLARASKAGVDPATLIFDPGIGFGKRAEQSLALMLNAATLVNSGGRWLFGHSRKSCFRPIRCGRPRHARPVDAWFLCRAGPCERALSARA